MILMAFTLTLQSEEMTNVSGLQGVNVSLFALFVSAVQGKKKIQTSIFFFFFLIRL